MTIRAINPFSYFVEHASQLRGFGGERPSPDPQYCFHTRYEAVRPGRAIYWLNLLGAQATQGELTVRVHAFRPDFGGSPLLAAGSRIDLQSRQRQELVTAIPFHAINGVEYALYAFFSEPTDLSVDQIEVLLEEPEGDDEIELTAPLSILAGPITAQEAGPATGLTHHGAVEMDRPVSQDCTWEQLGAGHSITARMAYWREAVCIASISAYDINLPDLCGWVVGEMDDSMRETLVARRFAVSFRNDAPGREGGEFADFILWPRGPRPDGDAPTRWAELHAWLERLKIGGFAIVVLRYWPDDTRSDTLSRNEIRQWAFRLIGLGYSIAPLAFAGRKDLVLDQDGTAACAFIVRRQ